MSGRQKAPDRDGDGSSEEGTGAIQHQRDLKGLAEYFGSMRVPEKSVGLIIRTIKARNAGMLVVWQDYGA